MVSAETLDMTKMGNIASEIPQERLTLNFEKVSGPEFLDGPLFRINANVEGVTEYDQVMQLYTTLFRDDSHWQEDVGIEEAEERVKHFLSDPDSGLVIAFEKGKRSSIAGFAMYRVMNLKKAVHEVAGSTSDYLGYSDEEFFKVRSRLREEYIAASGNMPQHIVVFDELGMREDQRRPFSNVVGLTRETFQSIKSDLIMKESPNDLYPDHKFLMWTLQGGNLYSLCMGLDIPPIMTLQGTRESSVTGNERDLTLKVFLGDVDEILDITSSYRNFKKEITRRGISSLLKSLLHLRLDDASFIGKVMARRTVRKLK